MWFFYADRTSTLMVKKDDHFDKENADGNFFLRSPESLRLHIIIGLRPCVVRRALTI